MINETFYSNYKEINGVKIAYMMEVITKGSQGGEQKISVDKIQINVDVDDSIFAMPSE